MCFTIRNPAAALGIGDRLNSANRKSLVFDDGKNFECGPEADVVDDVDNDDATAQGVKDSFAPFNVTFGVLLAF